jgi:hypothetical protein
MTDGRMARLDEWLQENCQHYRGDGRCEFFCKWAHRRSGICCYMECKYEAECRREDALCDIVEPPKELLDDARRSGMDFFEIAKRDAYEAAMKARNRPATVSAEKLDKIILVALERHFGGMSLDDPQPGPLAEHAIKKLEQVTEVCWERYAKSTGWAGLARLIEQRTDELRERMERNGPSL